MSTPDFVLIGIIALVFVTFAVALWVDGKRRHSDFAPVSRSDEDTTYVPSMFVSSTDQSVDTPSWSASADSSAFCDSSSGDCSSGGDCGGGGGCD